MAKLVRMSLDEGSTILVEVPEEEGIRKVGAAKDIVDAVDKAFDQVVKHEIVENCKVLVSAFQELKALPLAPKKAEVEFGLQLTAEGNVYVVKTSGQASYKITFEWELPQK